MTYTTPCKIIRKYVLAIVSSHGEGPLVNDGSLAIQALLFRDSDRFGVLAWIELTVARDIHSVIERVRIWGMSYI